MYGQSYAWVFASAVFALLSGCSTSDPAADPGPSDVGGGGGSGPIELADGTVGSSCNGACAGDMQCATDASIPNGYCTKPCQTDLDCSAAGKCVQTSSGAICFRSCLDDTECRPGYSCTSAGAFSVCDVATPSVPGTGGTGGSGGGDLCSAACSTLAGCGLCIRDTAGNCLSSADCATGCQGTAGGQEAASCILGVSNCDTAGFELCLGGSGSGGSGGGGSCKDLGVPCGSNEECCSGYCDPSPPFPGCL